MADPICRWRNPYVDTVLELINVLPKTEQSVDSARTSIKQTYDGDFFRTPYQLACQLGLYHMTNGFYFPKFTYNPSENELHEYLANWITLYPAPNPYTRSIPDSIEPFSIHCSLCKKLLDANEPINWVDSLKEAFSDIKLGNLDILRNTVNSYSPILNISKIDNVYHIKLKDGKSYEDLLEFVGLQSSPNREDKESFFDLFQLPNELNNSFDETSFEISNEERNILINLENSNIPPTERIQIAKSRIGQGRFRRLLIEDTKYCPFTHVNDLRLLIASHIKPWSTSDNRERLDPKNGLLLTPTYDKLFDRYLISFTDDKKLMVSTKLSDMNAKSLGLENNRVIEDLNLDGRNEYLNHHRQKFLNYEH